MRARRCAARWFGFRTWFSLNNCRIRLLPGWPVLPGVGSWPGSGGLPTQSPRRTPLSVRSPDSSGSLAPYGRWCRHSYTRVCRVHPAQSLFSFPDPLQKMRLRTRYRYHRFRPLYVKSSGRRGRGAPALGTAVTVTTGARAKKEVMTVRPLAATTWMDTVAVVPVPF